jgi:hypothetical protein
MGPVASGRLDRMEASAPEPARWERWELVVRLDITRVGLGPAWVGPAADPIVRAQLADAAADGWQLDGPIDWPELWRLGRVQWRANRRSPGHLPTWTYDAVTLPLIRPAP